MGTITRSFANNIKTGGKIDADGLDLTDNYTFTGTVTGAGANTPAFRAYRSSTQNLTDNALEKVQFDTETFDTNSCYDNSTNYRFTPNVAGKYFVYTQVNMSNSVGEDQYYAIAIMKKNTTELIRNTTDPKDSSPQNQSYNYMATVVDMNGSTDYIEVFAQVNTATGTPNVGDGSNQSFFGAYKIIE